MDCWRRISLIEALDLLIIGHIVVEIRRSRAGADRIAKHECGVELDPPHRLKRQFEVVHGFARKANNQVSSQDYIIEGRAQRVNNL